MFKTTKKLIVLMLTICVLIPTFSINVSALNVSALDEANPVTLLYSEDFEDTTKWPEGIDNAAVAQNGWTIPANNNVLIENPTTRTFRLNRANATASYVFDEDGYSGSDKLVVECRAQSPWSNDNGNVLNTLLLTNTQNKTVSEVRITTYPDETATISYVKSSTEIYTINKTFAEGKYFWIRQVIDLETDEVTLYYLESGTGDDDYKPGKMRFWGEDLETSTFGLVNQSDNISTIKIKGSRYDDFSIYQGEITASGLTYSTNSYYFMRNALPKAPSVIEATVFFPVNFAKTGGAIVSNYDGTNQSVGLYVGDNGNPVLKLKGAEEELNIDFDTVNLYNGKPTHLAVVNDVANLTAHCYINGELAQSKTYDSAVNPTLTTPLIIARNASEENPESFSGVLVNLALFDGVRTQAQIKNDFDTNYLDKSGMILSYDFSALAYDNKPFQIKDSSGNYNHCVLKFELSSDVDKPEDFSYSFAVLGDTQVLCQHHPQYMIKMYNWVVDNVEKDNIKFVFGLGDITNTNVYTEWSLAKACIQKLDGIVPYSLVKGNHDEDEEYVKFFPYNEYKTRVAGTFEGNMLNNYQFITVNGLKYLIFGLDYGAKDPVLKWAEDIIVANPDCNVIITTHGYLNSDGTLLTAGAGTVPSNGGDAYNDGDEMWEKLIKKHKNIVMVLSGHMESDYIVHVPAEGDNGNVVSQMLINPQETDVTLKPAGLVAMLYFSEDGENVDVRYYSTAKEKFFLSENQFSFKINVIQPDPTAPVLPTIDISNVTFDVNLTADQYYGKVIAVLYDEYGNITASNIYDASQTVTVSFPETAKGCKAKAFWWNEVDTITPISLQQ